MNVSATNPLHEERTMNFDDTPAEAAFRAEARDWIAANAPHHLRAVLENSGPGKLALGPVDPIQAQKEWQRRKFDAGWACLHWPKQYGGRSASPIERVIWQQEEGIYALLSALFSNGHGMGGPTVMAAASEDVKRKLLPRLASGEDVWCQLFSEPSAGSDLAGLRTRAVRDEEGWVVNGQKVWTSEAQHSDYGLLLARTNPGMPKHRGLTMFYIDMHAPGVEVRPIKQMSGQSTFSEVFLTDVRVPDGQRLGAVDDGWRVSLTTLMNERLSLGSSIPTGFPEVLAFCRTHTLGGRRAIDDARVKARLAQWAVKARGLRYVSLRAISQLANDGVPGPENSIGKLVSATMMQEIGAFVLDLQGEAGIISDPSIAPDFARFQTMVLRSPGLRIEGGADEILRNIIAERVLGLPQDIRVDKDVPFDGSATAART